MFNILSHLENVNSLCGTISLKSEWLRSRKQITNTDKNVWKEELYPLLVGIEYSHSGNQFLLKIFNIELLYDTSTSLLGCT